MRSTNQSFSTATTVDACAPPTAPDAAEECQQLALTPIADTLSSPTTDNGGACQQSALTLITDTPAELVRKYKVSLRTAKRMRKPDYFQSEPCKGYWGTFNPGRTVGRDGKNYPHQRHTYNKTPRHPHSSSLILEALRHARYGIRRADRIACEDGVTPRDMAALASLFDEISDIIGRWSTVSTDEQDGGGL